MQVRLEQITDSIQTRSVKEKGVEQLRKKIDEVGYLPEKPVVLAPNGSDGTYTLIDGNHRVEALKRLGFDSVEALIDESLLTNALQYRRARLANEVAETVVPTTFVDDAELVWKLLDKENGSGMTQVEVGSVLGWDRGLVNHFSRLQKIDTEAWQVVSNSVVNSVSNDDTTVSPFSEYLLRSVLSLTPIQQVELISDLANGKIDKKQFNNLAQKYNLRNQIRQYIRDALKEVPAEFVDTRLGDIDRGGFDADWETAGKPKIAQLIKGILDEWQQKSGTQLIHGDFEVEVLNIEDGIVNLILTDPPYNISGQGKVTKQGQEIVNADFGDWDNIDEFKSKLEGWAKQWQRVLAPGGSLVVFCDQLLISDLWRVLEANGLRGKRIITWLKTNPNPSALSRKNLISATEFMLWAVKPGADYTFNESTTWDRRNAIVTSLCAGEERIKDDKGDSLHPTQKPVSVLNPLVEVFSNRGAVVMDGFAGVGSTGQAAVGHGRKFIGVEKELAYFEAMQRRLLKG